MSKMMSSEPLETFLPAKWRLTLKRLLEGYGKWWCTLPSRTGYSRHFSTDGEHFLVVWEGYPGRYDHYGDFGDDDHFYNAVVKGDYYFYHVAKQGANSIDVWCDHQLRHSYNSLDALRSAMILKWGEGLETAHHQGVALHEFTRAFTPMVYELLRQTVEQRMLTGGFRQLQYKISVKDQNTYLSIWNGDANIFKSGDFGEYAGPKIQKAPALRYAELCVRILCVPHRLVLLERRSLDGDWFAPTYREWFKASGSEFEELKDAVEIAMDHLTWL